MTSIEFHYNANEPIRLAATLVANFVQNGRKVLIYAPDATWYQAIDRMLWTYTQLSFVPHCAFDADVAPETAVWLSNQTEGAEAMDDILVNLSETVPTFFSRFDRTIEIVGTAETERAPGRVRYKFYQDRGYPIEQVNHQP